jgi:hypothetical protein
VKRDRSDGRSAACKFQRGDKVRILGDGKIRKVEKVGVFTIGDKIIGLTCKVGKDYWWEWQLERAR